MRINPTNITRVLLSVCLVGWFSASTVTPAEACWHAKRWYPHTKRLHHPHHHRRMRHPHIKLSTAVCVSAYPIIAEAFLDSSRPLDIQRERNRGCA